MESKNLINFIFLGLGHMGERAILNFFQVREHFRGKGVKIELKALADPNKDKLNRAKGLCEAMLLNPEQFPGWEEIESNLISKVGKEVPTIIYDATNSAYHYKHLVSIDHLRKQGYQLYYFGEKPLISDENELDDLKDFNPFYCDLIETESVVFKKLRQYIISNAFKIKKMSFYRCSSMGLIKMFDPEERPGVMGGALEDKAPHDLSLMIALSDEKDWEITNANIDYFMPAERKFLILIGAPFQCPIFMTVKGRFLHDLTLNVCYDQKHCSGGESTADAAFDLHLSNKNGLNCNIYTSWIGVKELGKGKELCDELNSLKIPEEKWLYSKIYKKEGIQFKEEECRICILEIESIGKKKKVIANFLDKGNVKPFLLDISEDKITNIDLNENDFEFGNSSLARVFKSVINSVLGNASEHYLDKDTSFIVHSLLINGRKKAFGLDIKTKLKDLKEPIRAKNNKAKDKNRDARKEFREVTKIIRSYFS